MLLIHSHHQLTCAVTSKQNIKSDTVTSSRQDIVDEYEQGLLVFEFDSLANDVDELTHSQVSRNKVLLLVNRWQRALAEFLDNDLRGNNYSEHVCVCLTGMR